MHLKFSVTCGKTLLFLDEIQACPNALKALRFFHEKRKDLHVVAAGSLLEFALEIEGEHLYSVLVNHDFSKPLDGALHRKLRNKAGLAHFVYHTAATGIPLGASVNRKKFKVLLYDVGIYQRMMGTVLRDYLVRDLPDLIHRGNLVKLFAGLEFLASSGLTQNQLYYWRREARSANAEVDYVIQKGDKIVPVEVKSGSKGTMKSIHRFLIEKKSEQGIRFSQENVTLYDKVISLPIYSIAPG